MPSYSGLYRLLVKVLLLLKSQNTCFFLTLVISLYSSIAIAYDEIQVYDMSINTPGQFALEMHSNYAIKGRKIADYEGELIPDQVLAFTAEFSYGWTPHLEWGLYVPMSINTSTGSAMLDYAKLRLKWLNPDNPEFFYGLNTEIGAAPKRHSEQLIGVELRPIIGHYSGDWLIAFNPSLELDLSGNNHVPFFVPGLKVTHQVVDNVYVGFEHYAEFGQLDHFATGSEQMHTTYLVSDVSLGDYRLHLGIGHGWTAPSDEWMLKVIVGGIPFTELLNPNKW